MNEPKRKSKKKQQLTTNILMAIFLAVIVACVIGITVIVVQWAKDCTLQKQTEETVVNDIHTVEVNIDPRKQEQTAVVLPVETKEPPAMTAEAPSDGTTSAPSATPDPQQIDETPTPKPTAKTTKKPSSGSNSSEEKKEDEEFVLKTITVDFDQLNAASDSVIGYLYLQDSKISYPIVQSPKEDANYYLTHAYDGTESISGALFVDSLTRKPFEQRNTVVHGHRMNNGTMFGNLNKYKKQSYFEDHRILSLYTPDGNYLVYVFAAYESEITGPYSRTNFSGSEDFQAYLNECISRSNYDTGIVPIVNDHILTLSTCVAGRDTKRFVVQGILIPQA